MHKGHLDNRVENIASGSLLAQKEIENLKNLLVIVSRRRFSEAIGALCRSSCNNAA